MKFDEIYDYIGTFGVFQLCFYICIFVINLLLNDAISLIFADARVPHFCRVPQLANLSHSMQKYIAIPYVIEERSDEQPRYSACEMYAFDYDALESNDFVNWNRSERTKNWTKIVKCSEWNYDESTFVSTTSTRFDLVCSSEHLIPLISSLFMSGFLVGGILFGTISDRFGRKMALGVFMFVRLIGMTLSAVGVNYVVIVIGRFVIGVGAAGLLLAIVVMAMEIVPLRQRSVTMAGMAMAHSSGFLLHTLIAFFIRDDLLYQRATILSNIFAFGILFVLPESLRWLILNERYDEANALIHRYIRINSRESPPKELIDTRNIEKVKRSERRKSRVENVGCLALLRTRQMRIRMAIGNFIWFTASLTYFGLFLNVGTFAGDIYFNTSISASLEIPARIVSIFLVEWRFLGRRLTSAGLFLFASAACFICMPLVLYGLGMASTAASLIGKTFATMSFSVVYIFVAELFPTEVRSAAMGTCSISSRLGGMVAPYMGAPLMRLWRPLPYLVYGVVSAIAGTMTLLLPETLGLPLVDTVEQMEQLSTSRKKIDLNGSAKKANEAKRSKGGTDDRPIQVPESKTTESDGTFTAANDFHTTELASESSQCAGEAETVKKNVPNGEVENLHSTVEVETKATEQLEAVVMSFDSPAIVAGSLMAAESFVTDENFITHL